MAAREEKSHFRHRGRVAAGVTPRYLYVMAHRMQIMLTDEQYSFLDAEADRSGVSVAELIRRSIDTVYGVVGFKKVSYVTHALGRRPGLPIDDFDDYGRTRRRAPAPSSAACPS